MTGLLSLVVLGAVLGPSARASITPAFRSPSTGTGSGSAGTGSAGTGSAGPAGSPPPASVVRFTFDGPSLLADVSGHRHDLNPVARHGGEFSTTQHGAGLALVFPPPCHDEPCPRIALRAASAADLNPGTKPIRYGASVKLAADQTTKGENILQKGYSARGSQYKLQIDGVAGNPSCVLVDDKRPKIHVAKSDMSVADGKWHTLECQRSGTRVAVLVDGAEHGTARVPADLSVHNSRPLSVGSKGSFTDNDQFQGVLDDVWVDIVSP